MKRARPQRTAASTGLAPYAASAASGPGRLHAEPSHAWRSEFQRDRDRVIHSGGFRRLVYKTQVFINHEGDLYRTRLTHSLEVAQIARTVARALRLNEDLSEAIALAHDLGHPPFGHAGEDALNECMRPWGGFEHNLQSLRVVDELEDRYLGFAGLNLCFETREVILKHCSRHNPRRLGAVGERIPLRHQTGLHAPVATLPASLAHTNHPAKEAGQGAVTVAQGGLKHEVGQGSGDQRGDRIGDPGDQPAGGKHPALGVRRDLGLPDCLV